MTPEEIQRRLDSIHDSWGQYPGRAPGGTGDTGLASNDATGWSAMLNEQTEAENLSRRLQGQGPLAVKMGGSTGATMSRPSLEELQNAGMDSGSLRRRKADDVNAGVGSTFEQRREAGVLADMDARTSRGLEDARRRSDASFDLGSGAARAREREIGNIESEHTERQARTKNDIYFSPDERRRREDEFLTEMQRIRARYTDPAMIAAQARIEAEKERGQSAQAVEGTRQAGGIERQDLTNQGNLGVAGVKGNAQIGAEIAKQGGDPSGYRPQTTPGAAGKTFTTKDVQDYARDHNMSAIDALATFRTNGYTFVK